LDLLKPTVGKRIAFFLISDVIIFSLSLWLALLFRFNFSIPPTYLSRYLYWFVIVDAIKIIFLWLADIYKLNWRFVSVGEFYRISKSLFFAFLLVYFVNAALQKLNIPYSLPRSSVIMDFFISTFLVLVLRASRRVYLEIIKPRRNKKAKRTLIVGAGFTGERIIREMKRGVSPYEPVAIVDDDPSKQGTMIHQVRVVGTLDDIERVVDQMNIEAAIIAITTLNHIKTRALYDRFVSCGVRDIKIVPPLDRLPSTNITVKDLRDISIEDLLARDVAQIDRETLEGFLFGKVVFVSGAAGSIGSEIVRQLLKFRPKKVVGFEIDETDLHNLQIELSDSRFVPVVGDIRDKAKLRKTFDVYRPHIVFHAAAYKHVPMMEYFPEEAIKTNVFGTLNMAETAFESGVERFINISTDKAVEPANVMGMTKRLAEIICILFNSMGSTRFISVRFGNVLGSRGSVIPLFVEQIKKGGPVTVTHPEMKRYFMSIPEAVLLVLQAAAMGDGGETFVLDMGKPVRIVEIAERLIRLEGLQPYEDIEIVFTGIRPGEKLEEVLLEDNEDLESTLHPKIKRAKNSYNLIADEVVELLGKLKEKPSKEELKRILELLA